MENKKGNSSESSSAVDSSFEVAVSISSVETDGAQDPSFELVIMRPNSERNIIVDPSSEVAVSVSSFETDSAQDSSSELMVMSSNSESNSVVDPSSEVAVSVSSSENDSAQDPSSELVDMSSNSECDTAGDTFSELVLNSSSSECDTVENPSLGLELNIVSFESDAQTELHKFFAEVFRIAHSALSTMIDSDSSDSDETTVVEVGDSSYLNSTIPDENTIIPKEEKRSKVEVDAMEGPSIEFRIRGSLVIQAKKSLRDALPTVEDNLQITIPPFTLGVKSDVTSQGNWKSAEDAGSNEVRDRAENEDYAQEITEEMIASLLKHFKNNLYTADSKNRMDEEMLINCLHLYQKDYECERIGNTGGTLSERYPSQIIIPVKEKNVNYEECSNYESPASNLKSVKFRNLAVSSRPGRCRMRFPVPVMLLDGKFICRASTLSVRKGASMEQLTQTKESKEERVHDGITQPKEKMDSKTASRSNVVSSFTTLVNPNSMNELKEQDASLLKYLGVSVICDLMIEDRKIRAGISVSSSEKVNKEKYEGFDILQMPYPGCEFFKKYHEANRDPKGLKFDWGQRDVTAEFQLPEGFSLNPPAIDFSDYKEWDIIRLTKEYLLLQLRVITSGNCGFLVHCVCGWDRTPLFITLLRLSLWADGWIHQTLTPLQMAYLTLGYDWYLFGHDLPKRLKEKEEVMHFCFNFISEIASDDFSMTSFEENLWPQINEITNCFLNLTSMRSVKNLQMALISGRNKIIELYREWHNRSEDLKDNRRVPPFNPSEREAKLIQVRKILLDLYDEQINI